MSLDGIIAKPNDDLSFLDKMHIEGEDYGYNSFEKSMDVIIMGKKTYDWVCKVVGHFPHKQRTYVITRTPKERIDNVQFYTGDITTLVHETEKDSTIFCDGGAEIVNLMLKNYLIDEIILSIVPVLLGEGVRLFQETLVEQELQLISSKSYESGLVQLTYQKKQ
jgi:dihydrofolate reductase